MKQRSFGEGEADTGGQAEAPEDVSELEGGSPYTNIEMNWINSQSQTTKSVRNKDK